MVRWRWLALAVASCVACGEQTVASSSADEGAGLDAGGFDGACGGPPHAHVLAPASSAVAYWLAGAGFTVEPLPLDRPPTGLTGLIVLGSDASELPGYADYMREHGAALADFAASGNTLLVLAQRADAEARPPFMPPSTGALRVEAALVEAHVLAPDHFALAGVAQADGRLAWRGGLGHGPFGEQHGAHELISSADDQGAALLDLPLGDGHILLSALAVDRVAGVDAAHDDFADALYGNLAAHLGGCEPSPATDDPRRPGPPPLSSEPTVFVVLPDTQLYSRDYPDLFTSQTAWIADNVDDLNIRFVFHLGDLVNDNTVREWARAREAMALLDGVVPYAVVPGNHDYTHREKVMTRTTPLSSWFSYAEATARPGFGGAYEIGRTENTYHLFEAGGHEWIVLALEWGPRDRVVEWADRVMQQHDDRLAILVTHAYLNHNDRRYDHTDTVHTQAFNPHNYELAGGVNDGEELWHKLVRRHRFVMTFSGHVLGDGAGYLASRTDLGNTCHQMLSNYQMRRMGGEGYLRIVELQPDGRSVAVRTYSPALDSYRDEPAHDFGFELDVDD